MTVVVVLVEVDDVLTVVDVDELVGIFVVVPGIKVVVRELVELLVGNGVTGVIGVVCLFVVVVATVRTVPLNKIM